MLGEGRGSRVQIIVAIALVALVAAGAIAFFMTRGGAPQSPTDVEALFERSAADRDAARALKANFPDEYRQLLQRVADASRERGREAAVRETSQFMERFIRSKANAIIAAPDRDLQRIGGGQVALIQALRDENVNLCAQYAVRGLTPGTRLSPATLALLSRLSVVVIEAARAGEQPGRRPRPTLSDDDGRAWISALRDIDPAVARQMESNTAISQPPAGQCRAGVVLYEAVTRLPAATAANVTAFLVRESMNAPPPMPVVAR